MDNFVIESRILSRKEISCFGGRKYAEYEIEGVPDFKQGQYLMICTENKETKWPYPYFLHQKTDGKAVVLAAEYQDLYESRTGDTIQYWGPRGSSPLDGEEEVVLAAEPAVCFAVYPFLKSGNSRKTLILNGQKEEVLQEEKTVYYENIAVLAEAVKRESGKIIVALNLENAEEFAGQFTEEEKEKIFFYVSNKKACGMDGCKGCYLHSKENSFGINVCCKGPFMPLSVIDFEKDGKSFETFI